MKRRLLLVLAGLVVACSAPAPAVAAPDAAKLKLGSANALVFDAETGQPVYAKSADAVTPIASLTKLMTAMVTLDANLPMDELLEVDMEDFDFLKGSSSRLRMGAMLPRREMLRLALMASENRAASSLARHHPGGTVAFVEEMNRKAQSLGMSNSYFADATGLNSQNVSTALDLARMVRAAAEYPLIREFSTTGSHVVEIQGTGQTLGFNNTNALVKNPKWDIQVSKTGYIREAGKCLVMLATISSRPFVIVLLDSLGKYTRVGDAQRIKQWLETGSAAAAPEPKVVRAAKVPTPAAKAASKPKAPTHVSARTRDARAVQPVRYGGPAGLRTQRQRP